MQPHHNREPSVPLRARRPGDSQAQAVLAYVGDPAGEREHISKALRTPGAGLRGIDDRPPRRYGRHGGREPVCPGGILSVEDVLEVLDARSRAAADILDIPGNIEDRGWGGAETKGEGVSVGYLAQDIAERREKHRGKP